MNFKYQTLNIVFFQFRYLQFVLIVFSTFIFGCSIPNLENPECDEARETVKQFYSNHFGGDLKPNLNNLKKSEIFLTPRLFEELKNQNETNTDYFTQTEDYPKAFRVGSCSVKSESKAVFEVLLFWRDETRSEQKEIFVETVKESDKWLIDKVEIK